MKQIKNMTLFVILALMVWLLAACNGSEPAAPAATAESSASNAVQTAPQASEAGEAAAEQPPAAPLNSDPKTAILQAMRAQLQAGPYRNKTTITSADSVQEMTGEIIPPDRMHVAMKMGDIATEMIYIGDKVWSKQGDEGWQESQRMGAASGGLVDESMIADSEKTITEAAYVGPETVDGVAALLYTYTSDQNKSAIMPIDSVIQIKMWINAATGLIIRLEMEDETMGMKSKTVQVVEYDPAITIEPPVK
jgi:hypothetical protein